LEYRTPSFVYSSRESQLLTMLSGSHWALLYPTVGILIVNLSSKILTTPKTFGTINIWIVSNIPYLM
jgi:hypothetical protein